MTVAEQSGQQARTRVCALALALLLVLCSAGLAAADVTIERSSSILVFPKIIADGTRDTIVEIANTSNQVVRAHCFYVDGAPADPQEPPGPFNPPLWLETDFTIVLTRQQPTQWQVSLGRTVDPTDAGCSGTVCPGRGFDPGLVPPVAPFFRGELKCIEVDDSGSPLSGNHLLGVATIADRNGLAPIARPGSPSLDEIRLTGISKYNALGILGQENNGDGQLVLGAGQCATGGAVCGNDEDCGADGPCVPEYNACPETWILNHTVDGSVDIVLGEDSFVVTELTVVPCTQNFETQEPTTVTVQFQSFNEFESQFSVSTSVTCWGSFFLGDIGSTALTIEGASPLDPFGAMYMQTRMRAASDTPFGMLMVAEEFHVDRPTVPTGSDPYREVAAAAENLHREGERGTPDVITVPAEQLAP